MMNRKREWGVLSLLAGIQFVHIVDFMILMPLGPQLMRIYHIDTSAFSQLVAAYTFSAGIAGFLGAFFLDRFDRRMSLLFLMGGFTLGTFSCALAWSFESLLAARIIAGFFGGILNAQVYAIVADVIPYTRRGNAAGIIMSAFSLASVAGVPFGLYLANRRDWQYPFEVLAAISALLVLMVPLVIPTLRQHIENNENTGFMDRFSKFAGLFKNQNHLKAFLFIVVMMLSGFSVIPFISNYLVANLSFEEKDLPVMYLLGGGFTLFTARIIGKLADRFGKEKVYRFDAFLSTIPLFAMTHLVSDNYYLILTVSTLFFILVSGRMVPAMAVLSAVAEPKVRGAFLSMISSLQQLGSGLASTIGGLIIIHPPGEKMQNYGWVGTFAVCCTLIAIVLIGRLKPHEDAE